MTWIRRFGRGHRLLPHTADLIVAAWGWSFPACVEEAVRGLTASFAEPDRAVPVEPVTVLCPSGAPEEQLMRALEEVVFLLDTRAMAPAEVGATRTADGGLAVRLGLVPLVAVRLVGPAPKAVTWHGLGVERRRGRWRCRVTVDV